MTPATLLARADRALAPLDRLADAILPSLARLIFAGVLLGYFWASALTKFDGGPFALRFGAYAQIFPKAVEAAGGNPDNLTWFHTLVVLMGSWAEVLLPLLILLGLFTRLAALGMVGFILVQSLTDILGHGAGAETIGRWFDRIPDALILDQRGLWMLLLAVLMLKGGGPLSLDRIFRQWLSG